MMPELTCAACRDLLPPHGAHHLSQNDHALVERHLATCAACRSVARQWAVIGRVTLAQSQALPLDAQSDHAWQALRAQLPPRQPGSARERVMMNTLQTPITPLADVAAPRPHLRRSFALFATAGVIILSVMLFGVLLPHLKHTQGGIALAPTATITPAPTPIAYSATRPIVIPGKGQTPIIQIGTYRTIIRSGTNVVKAQEPSSIFSVNDFVYVVLLTDSNVKQGNVMNVTWTFNGVDITNELQNTKPDCCSETVPKSDNALQVVFAMKPPTPGAGKAEIYYNNTLADTLLFEVVTP